MEVPNPFEQIALYSIIFVAVGTLIARAHIKALKVKK